MSGAARLLSLHVGAIRTHAIGGAADTADRPWRTAYYKDSVDGPRDVRALGLDGDEQYDTRVHGGPERAVLAYSADHYPYWREEFGMPEMSFGGFGENLVISGLDERSVSIGDVFRIGSVELQVSSPRGPCSNISKRWKQPLLLIRVTENAWTGWYHRVRREGTIEAGQEVTRLEHPHPEWTVDRILRAKFNPSGDVPGVRGLAGLELLSSEWRDWFRERAVKLAG